MKTMKILGLALVLVSLFSVSVFACESNYEKCTTYKGDGETTTEDGTYLKYSGVVTYCFNCDETTGECNVKIKALVSKGTVTIKHVKIEYAGALYYEQNYIDYGSYTDLTDKVNAFGKGTYTISMTPYSGYNGFVLDRFSFENRGVVYSCASIPGDGYDCNNIEYPPSTGYEVPISYSRYLKGDGHYFLSN